MGELKIKISDEIERKFREYALKRYGYRKGALSVAAEKALVEVVKKPEAEMRGDLFLKSAGRWKDTRTKGATISKETFGIWKMKESGAAYVRKIRDESETRLKRMGL